MTEFDRPQDATPEWDPSQHPETVYINRFEEGVEPPPPEFDTLNSVPVWQVREEAFQPITPPLPLTPEKRKDQIYAALVWAAMEGAIQLDSLEHGQRPRAAKILPHAGLSLQLRERYFRAALREMPTKEIKRASERAKEIVLPPQLPWPPREPSHEKKQNSYDRLMEILARLAEQEDVPKEDYFSWGKGVSAFYHGQASRRIERSETQPGNVEQGLYYTKDLSSYPGELYRRLKSPERRSLEDSFVRLQGIPHLDKPEDLGKIVSDLPDHTPVLCFTSNTEAISLRVSPTVYPKRLRPRSWQKPMILMLNLVMLRDLRTGGLETSGGRLKMYSNYSAEKLKQSMNDLHDRLGAGCGVLKRSKHNPDPYYTYFWMAKDALILDARPLVEVTEEQENLPDQPHDSP